MAQLAVQIASILTLLLGSFMRVADKTFSYAQPAPNYNSRPVNVFFINSEANGMANRSVMNALSLIKEQYPKYLGQIYTVEINGSNSRNTVEQICAAWYRALLKGSEKSPDVILDTTIAGKGAEMVEIITAALGVPTISAQYGQEGDLRNWKDLTKDQAQYLIQITPPTDLVPEVIRQLSIAMNISNAAILFDRDFTMDHKYKSLLLNVQTRHVIMKIEPSVSTVTRQLRKLRELDIVNFFILGDQRTVSYTLEAAQKLNFTGRKYAWYTISLNEEQPQCSNCKNISLLSFVPKISGQLQKERRNELIDKGLLTKPYLVSSFYFEITRLAVLTMKNALETQAWNSKARHISCDSYNSAAQDDALSKTPIRNFDFLGTLQNISKSNTFSSLFDDYNWGKTNGNHYPKFGMSLTLVDIINGNLMSENEVANWTSGIGNSLQVNYLPDTINNCGMFWDGMTNNFVLFPDPQVLSKDTIFNHTALTSYRIVTNIDPPFVMYDNVTSTWSGYCIELLEKIQEELKFNYEIYLVEDGFFGTMDDEGNWNGLIKDVMDKKADMALSSLSVMAEREAVIDFTVPFYDLVGLSIMMLKPQASTSLFKFLTVLENEVWFSILGAYFCTSILMWVFDKWSPYSYQNNREKYKDDDEKREFTFKECLWFCMTSLTPQGGGEAPKNLSGRLIAATWWLFGFIIIASYTANLAAFLTVSRLDTPVSSLDDLSKQYKIQYATTLNSIGYQYFERMANIEHRFYEIWKDMSLNDSLSNVERSKLAVWDYPVSDKYTKMFQSMKDAGFPATSEEAIARVRNTSSQFAYIEDATVVKYLTLTNCDLTMVGEEFSRKPYAIAVQQGSPLKDQLNNAILTLLNHRKLEKLKEKWWNIHQECEKQDDQSGGISIKNIGGVFIVIFVGIGLACIALIAEYYYYRNRSRIQEIQRHRRRNAKPGSQDSEPPKLSHRPAPTRTSQALSELNKMRY